ncbi:DUF2280 domain-containing protein [Sinorhizobium meliloti]|uniref:DUF2280 domain-containing protein n=1 Tax=Rhizobium meliloti TaxID=382 RepID=UPI0013E402A9|nr:DUF2280 domain-containing protein [Sinorhizobium meliloti]
MQRVACFDPASIVDDAVGWIRRTITHQSVEGYHPTKKAGRNPAAKRKVLLEDPQDLRERPAKAFPLGRAAEAIGRASPHLP